MKNTFKSISLNEMDLEKSVIHLVEKAASRVSDRKHHVYDNNGVMELLHIKDKLLKKLRDNGLLGYSHYGDKFWYTQEDIDKFLTRFHYVDFSKSSSLPTGIVKGGEYD